MAEYSRQHSVKFISHNIFTQSQIYSSLESPQHAGSTTVFSMVEIVSRCGLARGDLVSLLQPRETRVDPPFPIQGWVGGYQNSKLSLNMTWKLNLLKQAWQNLRLKFSPLKIHSKRKIPKVFLGGTEAERSEELSPTLAPTQRGSLQQSNRASPV